MDNLFFISRKTQDKLLEFKVGGSVKFVNYYHDRIVFLDTMLCRKIQPIGTQNFLHFNSANQFDLIKVFLILKLSA